MVANLSLAAATGEVAAEWDAGILAKFAVVSTPMWCSAVYIFLSDIKPSVPAPGSQPLVPEGNVTGPVSERVASLESELSKVHAELEEEKRKVVALQADLRSEVGLLVATVDTIPAQGVMATIAGLFGVLAIAGPSTFSRGFLAITGSTVAALFVAGCVSYFINILERPFWFDCMSDILNSRGNLLEYFLFLAFIVLGVARWLTGMECGIYDEVEETDVEGDDGHVTVLHKPLLQNEKGGAPPLPPPTKAPV